MRTKTTLKRSKLRKSSPLLSVIIPARNEGRRIATIVRHARRITRRTEVIVICNGSRDQTARRARAAGARVINYTSSLGYDVARALGAKHARAPILLFLDADTLIPTSILRRYCLDVWEGHDLVLNAYSGKKTERSIHSTSEAKRLLNSLLQRPDLEGSSLTTVPHAMHRHVLERIGVESLMVPPKAHARAILQGVRIKRGPHLNMAYYNRRRARRLGNTDLVEQLIIGDHGEALLELLAQRGERGGFTDLARKRTLLANYLEQPELLDPYKVRAGARDPERQANWRRMAARLGIPDQSWAENGQRLSIILSVRNEERTIASLLTRLMVLNPKEVIIIENGSQDRTLERCIPFPIICYSFPFHLGHDVGRALGAKLAQGDVLLFLDGDMVMQPQELLPFVERCYAGAQITLNDLNRFYTNSAMIDDVSMAKAFLNRLLGAPALRYASLTAVPHGMRKESAEQIGYFNLAIPPKAQAMALVKKMDIQLVTGIDVFSSNRLRLEHQRENAVAKMILGDHVEALAWINETIGARGYLHDQIRKRFYVEGGT